jgi:hypothetical protein
VPTHDAVRPTGSAGALLQKPGHVEGKALGRFDMPPMSVMNSRRLMPSDMACSASALAA